ncbi:MAG: FG-GAP repeat domain-containing protein [Oscillospiraceae bacterium]
MKIKRILAALVPLSLMLLLSGCFTKSAEELYSLPQLSEGYLQLQEQLDAVQSAGAEFSAPTSGMNRQSVQLEDVDGDGMKEALAFFSVQGDEKPLKIIIFRNINGAYAEAARIEGEGANIDSVYYTDMNGDGQKEIIVGWQISAGIGMLSLYSARDFQITTLLSTNYTGYNVYDLNRDECSDLLVTNLSTSDLSGEVELFSLTSDGEVASTSARLTSGVESVMRVRTGYVRAKVPALFVESVINGSSLVTDIFTCINNNIRNITADVKSGVSEDTIRTYNVYCTDVNADGTLEVPYPQLLPSQSETTSYWAIDWYVYNAYGVSEPVLTTYHNYSDGWYLILPDGWRGNIAVRREDTVSGARAVVFSVFGESSSAPQDFLVIYTLSGANREEQAKVSGRFILAQEDETVYAAKLLIDSNDFPLTADKETIKQNFSIIRSEWITGET